MEIAWRMVEGRRKGDMEGGLQDASLDKVLAKSAVSLNASSEYDELGFATVDLSSFVFTSKQVSN